MDLTGNTRKCLKERLHKDGVTLYGFEKERSQVKDLFIKTAKEGESNSALLLSSKGGGKTTIVNSVIYELLHEEYFFSKTLIIMLNGFIQVDDSQALKSITRQLNLSNQVDGKVFKSFSENLSFLLSCLKKGEDSIRLIFIIDEFDLFCISRSKQTLIYNLFDVAQSAQSPICVLGVTSRFDAIELLEKRVKSRFSHRQIFLTPDNLTFEKYLQVFTNLLLLPTAQEAEDSMTKNPPLSNKIYEEFKLPFLRRVHNPKDFEFTDEYVTEWNNHIHELMSNERVVKSLKQFFEDDFSIRTMKLMLFELIAKLNENHKEISVNELIKLSDRLLHTDGKVTQMKGLSVLEICLLVAIKHHCDIYDNELFNFEIIFVRFTKFANNSITMQGIGREFVLKRFENLKYHELIVPTGAEGKVTKEYQMHKIAVNADQIDKAIQTYQNLPTEVEQWSKSSIV